MVQERAFSNKFRKMGCCLSLTQRMLLMLPLLHRSLLQFHKEVKGNWSCRCWESGSQQTEERKVVGGGLELSPNPRYGWTRMVETAIRTTGLLQVFDE